MSDQQHPLSTYFWIWCWLFVLSVLSYLVDISPLATGIKWIFITIFMLLKAGLIMAIFMHMQWERLSLVTMVILPPVVLLFALAVFGLEGAYIQQVRETYFLNIDFYRFVN